MLSATTFESFEAAAAASAVDKLSNNDDETRSIHCRNISQDPIAVAASEESSKKKRKRRPTSSLLKKSMEELDSIWINADKDGHHHDDDDDGTSCNTNNNNNNNNKNNNREAQQHTLPPSEMDRVRKTTALLVNVLTQDIHEPAIRALVANEELKSTQLKLKSELERNQKEVERLKRSDQRSKEAIKVGGLVGSNTYCGAVASAVLCFVLCVERCFFLRFHSCAFFSSHLV